MNNSNNSNWQQEPFVIPPQGQPEGANPPSSGAVKLSFHNFLFNFLTTLRTFRWEFNSRQKNLLCLRNVIMSH